MPIDDVIPVKTWERHVSTWSSWVIGHIENPLANTEMKFLRKFCLARGDARKQLFPEPPPGCYTMSDTWSPHFSTDHDSHLARACQITVNHRLWLSDPKLSSESHSQLAGELEETAGSVRTKRPNFLCTATMLGKKAFPFVIRGTHGGYLFLQIINFQVWGPSHAVLQA